MSEVKGTLLTIILVLAVFATVFTAVTVAMKNKATDVANKIESAGQPVATSENTTGANALVFHY